MAAPTDDLRATMEATMLGLLSDYSLAVRQNDTALLSARLSADCTRHLMPAMYPATHSYAKAVETNAGYEARMRQEIAMMDDARVKVRTSLVDPVARKGSAHAEHWVKIGPAEFSLEICWFFDFSADGKRICKITEFIDTLTSSKMAEQMGLQG